MLTNLMSEALEGINTIVGNYGLAIIIFTVILKLLMFPLYAKQTRSLEEMQQIQPEIEKIQKKYKDDKERQNEELVKLYQERGINPAAGCLPMVLTLIIIFPLYRAIYALDLSQTSFLWIKNLAEPDILLVIINGIATLGQTYLTTKLSGNTMQNTMTMWMMPIMIIAISFRFPAGVLVYWITQTIMTILQQLLMQKKPAKGVAK
ncbi:MAG: YidC/Oxa1 family membrane protein insertase [Halanaerobiales bacterium]|jgi:YidC/Oxa1 family membrane protein insertase